MKKRRVSVEELKKMKKAVFIWQLRSEEFVIVETTFRETHYGLETHSPSTLIVTANSIEEALLKMQLCMPNEKLLTICDKIANEDFCSPFAFVDLLEPVCSVNEVIL